MTKSELWPKLTTILGKQVNHPLEIMFPSTSKMPIIIIIVIIFMLNSLTATVTAGQGILKQNHVLCHEKDRNALSAFRQGIEDPHKFLSSWSTEQDCCKWLGVECNNITDNRLSGPIPKCLNMTTMVNPIDGSFLEPDFNKEYASYLPETYTEDLDLLLKGHKLSYKKYILLLRIIDLSGNELSGSIPSELFSLLALQALNLSHNHLKGVIPSDIGHMRFLESLDLSNNQLSGEIPQSLSNLSFLGYLNLSYNDFKGMIPLSTQLQSFDSSSYKGNPELCGAPLLKNCTQEKDHNDSQQNEDGDGDEFRTSFLIGMGVGFASGFWVVCSTIFFIRRCRHAYFRMLDNLYVFVVLKMNRFL